MPVKKILVNDCIKGRKKKGYWGDYLICEFVNCTRGNIFLAGVSDISHCRKDTVKAKVLQKTWQSLPHDILEHSSPCPLSSSHHRSHEPLLTGIARLTPGIVSVTPWHLQTPLPAAQVVRHTLCLGSTGNTLEQRKTQALIFEQFFSPLHCILWAIFVPYIAGNICFLTSSMLGQTAALSQTLHHCPLHLSGDPESIIMAGWNFPTTAWSGTPSAVQGLQA